MISELTKLCRVSESTVYRWMRGDFNPDPLKRKIISDYLNMPERDLWPDA
nr:helix-turn-helix transcriptional regulator [Prevotella histicola]